MLVIRICIAIKQSAVLISSLTVLQLIWDVLIFWSVGGNELNKKEHIATVQNEQGSSFPTVHFVTFPNCVLTHVCCAPLRQMMLAYVSVSFPKHQNKTVCHRSQHMRDVCGHTAGGQKLVFPLSNQFNTRALTSVVRTLFACKTHLPAVRSCGEAGLQSAHPPRSWK